MKSIWHFSLAAFLVTISACSVDSSESTILDASNRPNVPANHCEIFLQFVQSAPNSHSAATIDVTVKVNWLGNDEFIERVGAYTRSVGQDLGNAPSCHFSSSSNPNFTIKDPFSSAPGIYDFAFPVSSGSVLSQCPGFNTSHEAAFFVQTNKQTYWLNPDMDSSKYFVLDRNGYDINIRKTQTAGAQGVRTDSEDMRYYNPLQCR